MSAHCVDLHLDFHPQVWSDAVFKEWADYYEFAYFALPPHRFIQKSYAWDGMFVGDAGSQIQNISGWEEGYSFTPNTPGYLQYGENLIQTAGNGHGLSDQFATAFNRFLVTRDFDRFLQAEELAIVCMESRGIIMDDVEILLDGSGYNDVDALFGTTDWTDPVEGRMWDSNHRGHYPIPEYYYLTGKRRAADAFDNLNKSMKYMFMTDEATRFDQRPSGYYLSHFARNYSITRSSADKEFLDFYWDFLHTPHSVEGNSSWTPIQKNGFFASWTPFESDCGFTGEEIKLIFASNWLQAAYDVFFLGGYEQAMDHIYAGGKWLMEIYSVIGAGQYPEYCYRPWHETTPAPSVPQDFWNAQDFPGISLYYEFFGNPAILQVLQNTGDVCWDCGGLGLASVPAFALENQKPDHTPPPKVTVIFYNIDASGNIELFWRNVADAVKIQIKYIDQEGAIKDLHTFNDTEGIAYWEMQHVADEPEPLLAGQLQSLILSLPGDATNYRFAMKSWDAYNNVSDMSEIGIYDPNATSVEFNDTEAPGAFSLKQNYPNPFNPSTAIQFALPKRSEVTLKVFNVLGKEVAALVNEELPSGEYKVLFKSEDLPSGVYFYRIKAEGFIQTRKLTLLK